jgi:FkbM family methyltransferase
VRTGLALKNIPQVPKYLYYVIKCFFVFKDPLTVLYHYLTETSPRERVVVLRNGLSICLSDHPHDIVTVFVVFIRKDYGTVTAGSRVVDIGANIGVFSLFAASHGASKVYAFEPSRQAYDVLLRSIAVNRLEQVIFPSRMAVTATPGETVRLPMGSSPYNQVLREDSAEQYQEVVTTTLRNILNENQIDTVDLLKMDCEGAEYEILFNADGPTLARIREMKMEFHRGKIDELVGHLQQQGFRLLGMDRFSSSLWVRRIDAREQA